MMNWLIGFAGALCQIHHPSPPLGFNESKYAGCDSCLRDARKAFSVRVNLTYLAEGVKELLVNLTGADSLPPPNPSPPLLPSWSGASLAPPGPAAAPQVAALKSWRWNWPLG